MKKPVNKYKETVISKKLKGGTLRVPPLPCHWFRCQAQSNSDQGSVGSAPPRTGLGNPGRGDAITYRYLEFHDISPHSIERTYTLILANHTKNTKRIR